MDMKKVKFISAKNCEKDEKFGDKWIVTVDAGKGPFDAWYQGKKDLAPLVDTEADVEIENKPFFGNPNLKFKIKFPGGGGWGGGKAYNPTPDQQMRMAAVQAAANSHGPDKTVVEMAEIYYTWIKG